MEARHTAGAWRRKHAHSARARTHALLCAAGWAPPKSSPEDRLVLLAKSSSGSQEAPLAGGVHGRDGSEVGGKAERLHPLYRSPGVEAIRGAGGSGRRVPAAPVEGVQTGRSRRSGARLREAGGRRRVAAEQPETGGWLRGQGFGAPSKRRALPEVSWPGRSRARGLCCCVRAGTDGSTH